MSAFESYFSESCITRELCKARVSLAGRRHEALFFHNIDGNRPSAERVPLPGSWREISVNIFPPRKAWNRYRPKNRDDQSRDINLDTLVRAVSHLSEAKPEAEWASRLRETVSMIRNRALFQVPFSFSAPVIVPEAKDRKKRTYRPLSSLFLSDRIIDCLTARYFREMLNSALLDSCLAFRPNRDGRHDGLDAILNLRQTNSGVGLFAAECDIKGFYDCVSHDVARQALHDLITDAKCKDPTLQIEARATEIFNAYLNSYSFLRNVRLEAEPELRKRQRGAAYPWRDQELRDFHAAGSALDEIGVPQGGSLSTLIANAVLHAADKAVQPYRVDRGVTYLRYCDDMIVLSPDRSACAEAFDSYRAVLCDLKLPIHDPHPLKDYRGAQKKEFWGAKSKPVFLWTDSRLVDTFPWIQFLGYQIRYDGVMRIRPDSVGKELAKLATVTDKMLRSLRPNNVANIRRSPSAIKHRFRMKLIAMAVGRRDVGQSLNEPLPKSWANGFRWLAGKNVVTSNLKALDRQRERQLNRVVRRVRSLNIDAPKKKDRQDSVRSYYGFPYSYRGQFMGGSGTNGAAKTRN